MRTGFPQALAGQRIGILGGSFDPAHDAHLLISRVALRRLRLDRVWWLVSPGNPLKAHRPGAMAQRLGAARRLAHDPRILVTDLERRIGTRMTADTLSALTRHYPGVRFVWLMGSDNMVQFHRWDRWRIIADLVPVAVMARPGTRLAARNSVAAARMRSGRLPETRAGLLADLAPPAWTLLNLPMSGQSSTRLRAAP